MSFDDGSALSAGVQMDGGLWAYGAGTFENPYLAAALAVPSRLEPAFDAAHLAALMGSPDAQRSSLKAFLPTKQRVPERNLFGIAGGYPTRMSRHTVGRPCTRCGSEIVTLSYLGGAIYVCPACRPV